MRWPGLAAAAAVIFFSIPSYAQNTNQVGTLVCSFGANFGKILGSRQSMACVFHKRNGDTESYAGTLGRVGLDIGMTSAGRMAWTVFKRTSGVEPRALAGTYVGASGDASLGLGAGANVLVGGSQRTISLQPVSLEVQTGINVALGVARLTLR